MPEGLINNANGVTDMTITATFSNGHTDTYKGNRDVRAAWAIIRKADGVVLKSGHSLDTAKALKTAEGNLQSVWFERDFGLRNHPLHYVKATTGALLTSRDRAAARQHNAARLDLIRSLVTIEVVAL